MVGIIDYGLGNLGSIKNMLKVIGEKSIISSDKKILDTCTKYILPGVGAFDSGMRSLIESGIDKYVLNNIVGEHKPLLGICLGMQLLGNSSEEGTLPGLGLIPFYSKRFHPADSFFKVPHMGWDIVNLCADTPLLHNISEQQRYYFVHSYYAVCENNKNVLMSCDYGVTFAAAVFKDNIYGVQFHPEKSHDFGMALLRNFVKEC